MNKRAWLLTLCLGAWMPAMALQRIGEPVSPSLWDEFLPAGAHPASAADLGGLQEGRLSFGVQNGKLADLTLSVPGLQVMSAWTLWPQSDTGRAGYDPDLEGVYNNAITPVHYRDLFRVAGGVRLSNFRRNLNGWDAGVGFAYSREGLYDHKEALLLDRHLLSMAFSIQYQNFSFSTDQSSIDQMYRLGWRDPGNLQGGLVYYSNPKEAGAFGLQGGLEKTFRESMKFRAGLRQQYHDKQRLERLLMFGMSLRFRPWRDGVDPAWIQGFVAPGRGSPNFQRFLYDWEIATDMMVDQQYGSNKLVFSLSRWL